MEPLAVSVHAVRLRSGVDVFIDNAVGNSVVCVAFHLADQSQGVVTLPIANLNYAITDPWGRYS